MALVLWSLSALFACLLARVPLFQMLMLVQGVALVASLSQITIRKRWKLLLSQPLKLWIATLLAVCGTQLCYLLAFRNAPAAQVDLINYLWPVMVAISGSFLANTRFSLGRIGGALFGFAGVALLFLGERGLEFGQSHIIGYLFAFTAALCWTFYVLVTRKFSESPADLVGLGAIGPLIIGITGFTLGDHEWIPIHFSEGATMVGFGALSFALASPLWDWAIKRGRFSLVTVLSYVTPALSVLWLVLAGYSEPSWILAFASLLVILGTLFTTFERRAAREQDEKSLPA